MLVDFYRDCDGDGYGATGSVPMAGCTAPSTPPTCGATTGVWVPNGADCNDANAAIRPGVMEPCDGVDNDCDGTIDGAPAGAWCLANMPLPHAATETCTIARTCIVGTCTSPYGDCSPTAGCETDLSSTYNHCSTCSTACTFACVSSACADTTEVEAGGTHACARESSGTILCWGDNAYGELGDGTMTQRHTPVPVSSITDMLHVRGSSSSANQFTCAIPRLVGPPVVCWGNNTFGQLGNGTTASSNLPVSVMGLPSQTTAVALGAGHACALSSSGVPGTVYCWGDNTYGQLGDGTTTSHTSAVAVSGISTATVVASGSNESCVVLTGGTVECWGHDNHGQLGDGTMTDSSTHVAVAGIVDATSVAVGGDFACALHATGTVSCWGANAYGELGNGTTSTMSLPVVNVPGVTDAVEIAAGNAFVCARRATNGIVCWGDNTDGQIGDGTTVGRTMATAVSGITNAAQITCGFHYACAYLSTGAVKCWGHNASGQLGDGTTTDRYTPVTI